MKHEQLGEEILGSWNAAENTEKKTQYPFLTLPRSQRWWDSLTWATCSGSLFHRHHASWCDTECVLLGLGSCKRVYSHRSTSLSRFTFPQKRILQRKLWDDSAGKGDYGHQGWWPELSSWALPVREERWLPWHLMESLGLHAFIGAHTCPLSCAWYDNQINVIIF